MTLFEAQTSGAFDRLNWQHSGEFDRNFSKMSNAPGFAGGGGGGGGMGGFGIDQYIMVTSIAGNLYCQATAKSCMFSFCQRFHKNKANFVFTKHVLV